MASLTLDRLTKRFGAITAVDQMSLDVRDGELVCLLGPSGCGKSTALRLIAGFEEADEGEVRIDGVDVSVLTPNRRPTGMVFQSHALWPHMTVYKNIGFGLTLRHLQPASIKKRIAEVLELVGLTGYDDRYPSQLSGGQQQRVAIARCLVLEPKILLMDEPFSSLDAHLRVRLRTEVRAIQSRLGLTTIFVTHDQDEALSLSDRIVVLNAGRVEQVGSPSEIYTNPVSPFVAGFIGTMNQVETNIAAGAIMLGSVRLPVAASDGPCQLAIRPEDLLPVSEGITLIRGVVERVVDFGSMRMVDLVAEDGLLLKIQLPKGSDLVAGASLSVTPVQYTVFKPGERPVCSMNPLRP
ncbi:MAG: ABC transporter ATP-binding protein [Proteobacteria bacterium]|nr:ABC transporter ATP-binding protein [Pseudomonadota bacterium]